MRQRLNRLNGGRNGYRLLALDHGLSVGCRSGASSSEIAPIVRECRSHIDGVVLTYGMAKKLPVGAPVNLILQCFGTPNGAPRVEIASVESALKLDACAVSVQFNLQHDCLSDHTREIAKFTQVAHSNGLPVLFMTSGFDKSRSDDTADIIRICAELGADLIKVELDARQTNEGGYEKLRESVAEAPPLLLAGGVATNDIALRLEAAMQIGFAGYCIGRTIFGAQNPQTTVYELDKIIEKFYNEGIKV